MKQEIDFDFISDHLPNYHSRDDVMQSDDLQRYIDGELPKEDFDSHIFSVHGRITVKEAKKILNELDRELMDEAIEASKKK